MDRVVDNIGPPPSYSHLTCKGQRSQSATPPSLFPLLLLCQMPSSCLLMWLLLL
ncbi:hypothetical protein NC653_015226 [Populus alba x Populus x berolinensis]|uniref:Uncharacterized protein n=1 Tax=Populus alba x Populus x berolinensis TaxID=444605 RepID=A0AAD6QK05_9ROSI|nr:hypothetical protein NC653_015226 [Populus alba x Populus x berolinensis]